MPQEGEEKVQQQQEETTPQAVEDVEKLRNRLAEYERMLLDPDYLEYLATKGEKRLEEERREAPQKLADLDDEKKLEYLLGKVKEVVQQEIGSFRREMTLREVQRQIEEVAKRYPDFFEYKDEMVEIAKRHPTIGPEEAYLLAKSRKPKVAPKARVEPPVGGSGSRAKVGGDFRAAFEEAWKRTFRGEEAES